MTAIALVGRRSDNLQAVVDALERQRGDPEIMVRGVATLFALCTAEEARKLLTEHKLPLEGAALLASAQHSNDQKWSLLKTTVDIDKAPLLELRMASLLVGMNKAPDNLFSKTHENRIMIGELNKHDDDLVAQYSIWAIAESNSLGLCDLGVPLQDIDTFASNVRGWIYRLITADEETAENNIEYLRYGAEDQVDEAREGLAIGIRNVYFDGLEQITFDWLPDEPIINIRHRLLEHMSVTAGRCVAYEQPVIEEYSNADRLLRTRLEAAAQQTELYGKLRRVAISTEQASLDFGENNGQRVTMVQQNINTGGGSIGIISGEGTVIAQSNQAVGRMNIGSDLKPILGEVLKFIEASVQGQTEKEAGAQLVNAAAVDPTKGKVDALLGWLKGLKEGSGYVAATSVSIGSLVGQLSQWLGR